MKKIDAIIRPEKFDDVLEELEKVGWNKMTVTEVKGRGEQGGMKFITRGKPMTIPLIEKIHIMIVCFDKNLDKIVNAILKAARTDRGPGDGKIFISDCVTSIRISSGKEMLETEDSD